MYKFHIFVLIILILKSHSAHCREWDSLVQEYFPKTCLKENAFGLKQTRFQGSLAHTKTITQTDVNLCVKQGKRLYKTFSELDDYPTGESFPSLGLHIFFTSQLSPEIKSASKQSKSVLLATKILQNRMTSCGQMTPNTFLAFLEARGFLGPKFTYPPICPVLPSPRSYDGSCNNPIRPLWGAVNTPFTRIAPANYDDGLYKMAKAKSGNELPSARKITNKIFKDVRRYSKVLTNMAVQWGQLVAHDLSLRVIEQCSTGGVQCCSKDGTAEINRENRPSCCAPINVPSDDNFYSYEGIKCLNFVRSVTAPTIDGSLGPAQQMNTVSNFLDGSPIYSSKSIYTDRLRQFFGGKLHLTSKQLLPSSPDPNDNCDSSNTFGQCPCYLAGDSRVNQTPSLAALQTILAREHNRIAEELERLNPHWNDEKLFQETRKIIIAQLQHITYQEWLPLCIGREYVTRFKISPIGLYSYDYDSNVNPGIINAFATAAFRFFHTLIPGNLMICPSENYDKNENLRLSDHYLNPSIMEYYDNGLEAILRGTIYQPAMEADTSFSSEITNYLFKSINSSGIDLTSMDIQRGRDHGLANYNIYRTTCGMRRANTFEELSGEISGDRIILLKSMYEHVDDIDLFVGATMETDVHGSILGPTFQCIVGEQFYRTRVGDRYFYDVADMPHSFTSEQLREIKKASMARLICANSDVKKVQPKAFEMISEHNAMCSCDDLDHIPIINLQYWKENW